MRVATSPGPIGAMSLSMGVNPRKQMETLCCYADVSHG
jgi:hypothetical protein